jgi:hypothetical protein
MRIKSILLILLVGVVFGQQTLRAEETKQKSDSLSQSKQSATAASDTGINRDDAIAHQSDIVALQDLISDQIKRVVTSAYTVNFSGYGALGFTYTQFHDFTKDKTHNFTFNVPYAGLNFGGNLREDPKEDFDLQYTLMTYFTGNGISLLDVNLKWGLYTTKRALDPFFTLNATIGQQQVLFGSDNQASEDQRPTINFAQYLGKYGIGRDIGLKFDLGFLNSMDNFTGNTISRIALSLAAFNGAGMNALDSLGRRAKDLQAKLLFTPLGDQYFNVLGQLSFGGTADWQGVDDQHNSIINPTARYGLQLNWLKKPLLITGEAIVGNNKGTTPNAATIQSQSWVGTIFYTPNALPNFQPLVRYDYYDPNVANNSATTKNDASTFITAGFNWFFYQTEPLSRRPYPVAETNRVIKLQFNYVWKLDQNSNGKIADNVQNNQLLLQAFFNF